MYILSYFSPKVKKKYKKTSRLSGRSLRFMN